MSLSMLKEYMNFDINLQRNDVSDNFININNFL